MNHAPVVGLRLDLGKQLSVERLPKGLRYFVESPLEAEYFAEMVPLTPELVRGTVIERFLAERYGWG